MTWFRRILGMEQDPTEPIAIEINESFRKAKRNFLWAAVGALLLGISTVVPMPEDAAPKTSITKAQLQIASRTFSDPGPPVIMSLPIFGSKAGIDKGWFALLTALYLCYLSIRFRYETKFTRRRNAQAFRLRPANDMRLLQDEMREEIVRLTEHIRVFERTFVEHASLLELVEINNLANPSQLVEAHKVLTVAQLNLCKVHDDLKFISGVNNSSQLAGMPEGMRLQIVTQAVQNELARINEGIVLIPSKVDGSIEKLRAQENTIKVAFKNLSDIQTSFDQRAEQFTEFHIKLHGADVRMFNLHDVATVNAFAIFAFFACLYGNYLPIAAALRVAFTF